MPNKNVTGWREKVSWIIVILLIILGFVFLYISAKSSYTPPKREKPICTLDMFGYDQNANHACRALDSLQNNWFPSPIAGLFSYQAWNGFDGFWQNGLAIGTLAEYMLYTNSSRYLNTLMGSLRSLNDLLNAYQPVPSCDDELWYGLSYARAYELTHHLDFLDISMQLFDWTWDNCWDSSNKCNGGMFFDNTRGYKGTITTVEALKLAPILYVHTKKHAYLDKAYKLLNYILENKVLDPNTYYVHDNIDTDTCAPSGSTTFTYESGVTMGALTSLFMATDNHTYLELAHSVAQANIHYLSYEGILVEQCDNTTNCEGDTELDAKAFKGIFVQNLRYLMDQSNSSQREVYQSWLQHNINTVLNNSTCFTETPYNNTAVTTRKCDMVFKDGPPFNTPTGPVFTESWRGPFIHSTPIEHTSALNLLNAAISPGTKCEGMHCNFDPNIPDTDALTCADDPCPYQYTCCSWDQKYHTCCTPGQKCIQGGCY